MCVRERERKRERGRTCACVCVIEREINFAAGKMTILMTAEI